MKKEQQEYGEWDEGQTKSLGPGHREASATECPLEDPEEAEEEDRPLCKHGCGRFAAEGSKACCRTCNYASGKFQGPKCQALYEQDDPAEAEAAEAPEEGEPEEEVPVYGTQKTKDKTVAAMAQYGRAQSSRSRSRAQPYPPEHQQQ